MAITPPNIRIRIYQLEENIGGTDLQKKASPAPVEYATTTASPDFFLISMSDITETIEIDKGVYKIDSMSLTVDGLSESFFNSYSDPLNEPFVCEIYDKVDGEVIFHGAIDRGSVRYNPRNQYTSFDVLSWGYVLEQTTAAARSSYETKLTREYEKASGQLGLTVVTVPRYADDGEDMSVAIVAGDISVMETAYGEWRSSILGVIDVTTTEISLVVIGEPETVALSAEVIAAGACARKIYQTSGQQWTTNLEVTVVNENLWGVLNGLRQQFLSTPESQESRENSTINMGVTFFTSGFTGIYALFPEGSNQYGYDGRQGRTPWYWRILPDDQTVVLGFPTSDALIADALANGLTIDSIVVPTSIAKGTKVRVLGKDVYGYAPTGVLSALKLYDPDQVIEGLFSLAETGIFKYLANSFTYPTGFTSRKWSRFLEWPNNLIKSLRLMQNTERCFLKMTPTLDGSDLPRMSVTLIDRNDVNVATLGAATALTGVIDYEETSADLTPRGVVTSPHLKYMIPKGRKKYKTQGHWDKTLADDPTMAAIDVKTTVPPEGSDVIKFSMNKIPDWSDGLTWASNSEGIYVPENFKNMARYYYEFYVNLPRTCEIKMDGKVAASLLGEFVGINEGGLTRTVFVTSRSYNPITRDTTLKGRVGEYTPTVTADPVAVIDGDLLWADIGATGSRDVSLSGMRSYSPIDLPLTYLWELDPLGTPSTIGTDAILQDYTLTVGSHVIGLTVDDGTTTDQVVVTVVVSDDTANVDNNIDLEADFVAGPYLTITGGDVYITASGDRALTQDSSSIKVEYSLVSAAGPWTTAVGSPFNNPITTPTQIYTGLAEAADLWVKVTLVNRDDGTDSANTFVGIINNLTGADAADLNITNLLNLDGTFDMDEGAAGYFSVNINAIEFLLIDQTGTLFDLGAGDSFDVMNAAGTCFTVDDTGTEVFVLSGDSFRVDVLGTDFLTINEAGTAFVQATGDEFSITHNAVKMFDLDDNGIEMTVPNTDYWRVSINSLAGINLDASGLWFDIATGDDYRWDVNSVLQMTLDATNLTLNAVNLVMGANNITSVGSITATGTIAGTINATGGASFGPGAVTSITVVNGIVTAIS